MNTPDPGPSNRSDQQSSHRRPISPSRRTLFLQNLPRTSQGASPTDTTNIAQEPGPSGVQHTQYYPEGMEREGEGQGAGADRSSPSASSSQGDMADTEMEAGQSQQSEGREPTENAPKKKRTRTLTTPHQSAVLHALLAQSRFPTTAMREEVGRSIGLSARKVQIWFQNQRQKARRPRGQPTAPLTRPPQYGPFSNMPPGAAHEGRFGGESPTRGGEGYSMGMPQYSAGPSRHPDTGSERHQPYMAQPYPRSMSLSQLSGPGIPGPSSSARPQYPLPLDAQMAAETSARMPRGFPGPSLQPAFTSTAPPSDDPTLETYRVGPHHSRRASMPGDTRQQRDYPLTLPPIVETPNAAVAGPSTGNVYPPLAPISTLAPVPPPAAMAEHQRRHSMLQAESPFAHTPSMNLPPPFTMQPRPQWDDTALSPFSRPGSSSLSRPGSSYDLPPGSTYILPPGMDPYHGPGTGPPASTFSPTRPLEGPISRAAHGQPSPVRRFDPSQAPHLHDPARLESVTPRPHPEPSNDDTAHEHARR